MGFAEPLSPYPELIAYCDESGYRTHLDIGREGWTLDVFEKGALIARATSTRGVPDCFRDLATKAAASLGRAGRK